MSTWNHNSDHETSRPVPAAGSSGSSPPRQLESPSASQTKLQKTQAQVNEVVNIMRSNVEKVLERDTKLSELDTRAEALNQSATQFERQSTELKRKFWWRNLKMMIILGIVVAILIIILAVWITSAVGGGKDDTGSSD